MRRAVGMAWQRWNGRQTKPVEQGRCRRTQPADNPTDTGLVAKQQPAVGRPRSKTTAADDVGRPLAVQCRLVEGVRWCWPLRRPAQTYSTCLPPTYRLCLSPSQPTPLIYKTQFSPNLFFFVFIIFIFLPHYNSSPNPLYCLCSANLSRHLAYSQPLRSLPGGV